MVEFASLKDILGDEIGTLKRASLSDDAYEKLRELILVERLPPGLSLNERELCEMLGISRTPVRDAIRQLEIDGLVEYSESRRPHVADPSLQQLEDWLVVQGALEALAGELACKVASDAELQEIAGLQAKMVELAETPDRFALFGVDMAFHRAIVAAAHNPSLVDTHRIFNARLWRARFVSSQRLAKRDQQMKKHQDIVEALLARDGDGAARALRQHLTNAVHKIADAFAERDKPQKTGRGDGK